MEQRSQSRFALFGFFLSILTILAVPTLAQTPPADPSTSAPAPQAKLISATQVFGNFANGQSRVPVIVNLIRPTPELQGADWNSPRSLETLRAANQTAEDEVLNTLATGERKVRFRFQNQAGFSCEVTRKALNELLRNPRVESIEPVRELHAHLAQGLPLMNALASRSTYTGTNMAIAICDTGIDYHHPRLGGGGFPNSKVIGGYDFGDNDADPIPNTQAHGTCCAGIAAGDLGTVGDYIGGVAPGAKLYALKISSNSTDLAASDAMTAAWDWCVTHKNDNPAYPILVISTSFGGGQSFSACDGDVPAMTTAANNAVAAGITVLASSGNEGYCAAINWPACISSVISVGAVYDADFGPYLPCVDAASCASKTAGGGCSTGYYATDNTQADKVTSYSNVASFLDVFAPADQCYTLDITGADGYDPGDYFADFGGTSAACPYAAGAVACLQNAAKVLTGSYLTPADVRSRLADSGDLLTDSKVALAKPRVNLGNAINSLTSDLRVTPITGLTARGTTGGPFSPANQIYTLSNATASSLSWIASNSQTWVSLGATNGTLPAEGTTNITVSINANADALSAGTYSDSVLFTNLTSALGSTRRAVTLSIQSPVSTVFFADFEDGSGGYSDDGFTYTPDPNASSNLWHGTTRRAVSPSHSQYYGLESTGNYNTGARNAGNLLSPSISLLGVDPPITLSIKYLLATESFPGFDVATVEISTNAGSTWLTLDSLADSPSFTTWSANISAFSGNNISVRFNFDTVDELNNTFEGLYIDDVMVAGVTNASGYLSVDPITNLNSSGFAGGPFSPSNLVYGVTNIGSAVMNWAASKSQIWVSLSVTNGVLPAGASTNVTVSLNASANSLNAGSYSDTVTFTNLTNGAGTTNRGVNLTVNQPTPTTILADAGDLFGGSTNNFASTNSVAVLVVDTGNNGFADLQPTFSLNLGATWGTDDRIIGLWNLTGCNCGNGRLLDQTVVAYTNGVATGQRLQLYWFPSLTLSSNTLGETYYGKYTDTNHPALNGSDDWKMPTGGSSVHLKFWTTVLTGSNPQTAGLALLFTGGPSFLAWQQQYFGCTDCSRAAQGADPDGDGQNNLMEFMAGTVPTNSASAFRILAIARENDNLRVTWMMGSEKTNALQTSTGGGNGHYSTNNFFDIFNVSNAAGALTTNYLDVGAATNLPSRFYRVRLMP